MVFNNALGGPNLGNIGAPILVPGYQGAPNNTGPFHPM
jgi:hypothetical protein